MSAFWFLCILFTFSIENYRLNFSFEYSDQPLTRKSISKHTLFQKRRLVRLYLLGAVSAAIYMFRPKWWNKNHMVAMHTHTHTIEPKKRTIVWHRRKIVYILSFVRKFLWFAAREYVYECMTCEYARLERNFFFRYAIHT